MDKKVIFVQHASGEQERLCPKCNGLMRLHEGGYSERFECGEYSQIDYPDQWECMDCGLVMDDGVERELELAFGVA